MKSFFILNKLRKIKKEKVLLLGIFFLSLFLRCWRLKSLPWGFHGDEVMNGYVGRFILLNGKDLYGNHWPVFYFNRFGDYPNVIPMYFSGFFTFIFGVNEFAVRFPSAFFGALAIFPFYFLSLKIFKKQKAALFSSFLLSILPWHLVLSRATSEGILGLTFFSVSLWGAIEGFEEKNYKIILLSLFGFLLTYFLYPSFRIFTPLALFGLVWVLKSKNQKLFLFSISVLFILITFLISRTYWGQGRFRQTSLFYSEEVSSRIKANLEALSFDYGGGKIIRARIFHNKIIAYAREFLTQYLSYFSPKFLFLEGGLPHRYVVPYQGVLFIFCFLFFLTAFFPPKTIIDKDLFIFFLYLLLISPLAAALTVDDVPNVHRAVPMILPLVIVISYGFLNITDYYPKIKWLLVILIIGEFSYFWNQYSIHTASFRSYLRDDGSRELILKLKREEDKYEQIFLPTYGTLPLYYLFYNNNFSGELAGKFKTGIEIDKIGKYFFVKDWCPSKVLPMEEMRGKILVVDQGDCSSNLGLLKTVEEIIRKDSTKAYRLLVSNEN